MTITGEAFWKMPIWKFYMTLMNLSGEITISKGGISAKCAPESLFPGGILQNIPRIGEIPPRITVSSETFCKRYPLEIIFQSYLLSDKMIS